MPFRPKPHDTITIADITYSFTEHPAAPGMAYGQAGRRGTVYQLTDEQGGLWALKVFLSQYREPRLAGQAERLRPLAALPGLRAAERIVLTSSQHRALIREHLDLAYAVQMPWISGRTWMEVILSRELLPSQESLQRAAALAAALVAMEERGLAHCDLSGPNLILPPEGGIELVDLEEMYGPELLKPEGLPGGSPGYAHKTAPQGLWNSRADRFSGAVLLAEMLGWCDQRVLDAAWGEGYFQPEEMGASSERLWLMQKTLSSRWGKELSERFEAAWFSETLASCPTFSEWLAVLPGEVLAEPGKVEQDNGFAGTDGINKASPVFKESDLRREISDPGLLILAAEQDQREGRLDEAIEKLERSGELGSDVLNDQINNRLSELHSKETKQPRIVANGKQLTESWICPICGERIGPNTPACPHCEQGELPGGGAKDRALAVESGSTREIPDISISSARKQRTVTDSWKKEGYFLGGAALGMISIAAICAGFFVIGSVLLWGEGKPPDLGTIVGGIMDEMDYTPILETPENLVEVLADEPTDEPVETEVVQEPDPLPFTATQLIWDDFSSDQGWVDESGGSIFRDKQLEHIQWDVNRDETRRYYFPVQVDNRPLEMSFRINVQDWSGNANVLFGLVETLDQGQWTDGFPSGFFLNVQKDTLGYDAVYLWVTYSDRSVYTGDHAWENPYSWVNLGGNHQWYQITLLLDGSNWQVIAQDESGMNLDSISGTIPAEHRGYSHVMLFRDYSGGWESMSGYLDDVYLGYQMQVNP